MLFCSANGKRKGRLISQLAWTYVLDVFHVVVEISVWPILVERKGDLMFWFQITFVVFILTFL